MRLKNEVEYVFRILDYLSKQEPNKVVTSNEIAENENIPHLFGIRILKKMEKNGLIKIFKGAKGGYQLAKKPEEITLKDAVKTIEEQIILKDKDCEEGITSCSIIFEALERVEKNFLKNLEQYNFKNISCLNK